MNAAEFVSRLGAKGKPRKTLSGWQCCCPAHEDKSPSLSVADGDKGGVVLKCFAGCTADAVCVAAGLTVKDLMPPRPTPAPAVQAKPAASVQKISLDWTTCVAAFTDTKVQKLAAWRGYSVEFVRWLAARDVIGIFDHKIAFANHGDGGAVVSAHVRLESGKWIYKPAGQKTAPLVFGDTKAAGFILAFEGQWDAFSVMDKFGWHTANGLPDTAVFITRGAANGKLIGGQVAPRAVCYAFKQNDALKPGQKIPSGDTWLADIASHVGCKVLNVATPVPHKDANDWTRAGATKADLEAALGAAEIYQSASAPADTAPLKSAASSNRADVRAEYIGGDSEPATDDLPDLIDAAEFLAEPIEPLDELVAGILHKGSKLAFGGSSKSFKTWTLLDLAISVASGVNWLGRETARGKVLFVNFEIQRHPWQRRIAVVAQAKGVQVQRGQMVLWNLRGFAAGFKKIVPRIIARAESENFALIILDPIYKIYGGTDENAAGDVAALLNSLEEIAVKTGAAIAFGAHFAKGNAAGKEALDRISGSGVFARDPDSLLIFTKHEEDEAFTIDAILRNFAPVEPFVVRWNYPLMVRADDLDPAKLKQPGGRTVEHPPQKLLDLLPPDGLTTAAWLAAAEENHIGRSTFFALRKKLEIGEKVIESRVSGKWQPISPKNTP